MTTNSHDKWLGFMDANQDTMTVRDEEWCWEAWNAAWSAAIEVAAKVCDHGVNWQPPLDKSQQRFVDETAYLLGKAIRQKGNE